MTICAKGRAEALSFVFGIEFCTRKSNKKESRFSKEDRDSLCILQKK